MFGQNFIRKRPIKIRSESGKRRETKEGANFKDQKPLYEHCACSFHSSFKTKHNSFFLKVVSFCIGLSPSHVLLLIYLNSQISIPPIHLASSSSSSSPASRDSVRFPFVHCRILCDLSFYVP